MPDNSKDSVAPGQGGPAVTGCGETASVKIGISPKDPRLSRRLIVAHLAGGAGLLAAASASAQTGRSDSDPGDRAGSGRTGRTDNDPSDGPGRGRGASSGRTDSDPSDGPGRGRGGNTGRTDNDPSDGPGRGRGTQTGRTDSDPSDGAGRGRR
jgi:hypothetical protein